MILFVSFSFSLTYFSLSEHMFAANAFIRDYVETANASDKVLCPLCKSNVAVHDIVPEIVGLAEGQGKSFFCLFFFFLTNC